MSNYVYFISAGSNPIKIGVSDNPQERLKALQTAHYKRLHLLFAIDCTSREDALALETAFHRWYVERRLLNEWFNILPSQIEGDVQLLMQLAKLVIGFRQFTDGAKIAQIEKQAQKHQKQSPKQIALEYLQANPGDYTVRSLAEAAAVSNDAAFKALHLFAANGHNEQGEV